MDSSSWSQWVGRLFKRHAGVAICPKTLRSSFITWLRSSTDAPEVLRSAAHAMKHSEARQASSDYDQESDDRLVAAAYKFNLAFAAGFSGSAAGSSSDAPPPAAAQPATALPADAPPPAAAPAAAESDAVVEVVAVVSGVHAVLEEKVSRGKPLDGYRRGAKLLLVRWLASPAEPSWELASKVDKAAVDAYLLRKQRNEPPPPPPARPAPPPPPPPPPPPAPPRHPSRILAPVPKAELRTQLEAAGFERGEAAPNGDCYSLSAMAGFELSAAKAATQTRKEGGPSPALTTSGQCCRVAESRGNLPGVKRP